MPSHLDLPQSSHKMMVAPPRINLRRAASYNAQERGPLSATSSRFNFNHLLFSPPPSPGLPALVPRPKKTPKRKILTISPRPIRLLRRCFFLLIFLSNIYCVAFFLRGRPAVQAIWPYFTREEFEMVGQDELPDFATPIVVGDPKGVMRWTVSIPRTQAFPLSIEQYAEMASQCREVSSQTRDLHHKAPLSEQTVLKYDAPDEYFVDVAEAEEMGMLPAQGAPLPSSKMGHILAQDRPVHGKEICQSSMTFVLEGDDAGLGNTLMMLWTFYGMAKEDGRAFFIDDTRWAYGDYTDIFLSPPAADCRPPPRQQMLPCPPQARHLVVTTATAKDVFPALVAKHRRHTGNGNSLHDYFQLARSGYEALFRLTEKDNAYVEDRLRLVEKRATRGPTRKPVLGYHVRRGDQHPLNFEYQATYIPSEVFQDTSDRLVAKYHPDTVGGDGGEQQVLTILASDDPTVYHESTFSHATAAQERIRLASEQSEGAASKLPNPEELHDFEAQPFGWEGGFYAPVFWNLGRKTHDYAGSSAADAAKRPRGAPTDLTLGLRSLVGRAYMMDLAVLAGASDHVVCTVSAMGCRLLAVMMGWGRAMENEGWVNVDGDFGWAGIQW